jgi:hypothetical protein
MQINWNKVSSEGLSRETLSYAVRTITFIVIHSSLFFLRQLQLSLTLVLILFVFDFLCTLFGTSASFSNSPTSLSLSLPVPIDFRSTDAFEQRRRRHHPKPANADSLARLTFVCSSLNLAHFSSFFASSSSLAHHFRSSSIQIKSHLTAAPSSSTFKPSTFFALPFDPNSNYLIF